MVSRAAVSFAFVAAALFNLSCRSGFGPGCHDESGEVFRADDVVRQGETRIYTVVSPKSSNLLMRFTWTDTAATPAISATITDCGAHVGCAMTTSTPAFGPGGTSPVPQPWPPGVREMLVDGSRGKTWRIDIGGDPAVDTRFLLVVTYRITCES